MSLQTSLISRHVSLHWLDAAGTALSLLTPMVRDRQRLSLGLGFLTEPWVVAIHNQHQLTCGALPKPPWLPYPTAGYQKAAKLCLASPPARLAASPPVRLRTPAAEEAGSKFSLPSWGSVQRGCQRRRAIVSQSHLPLLWPPPLSSFWLLVSGLWKQLYKASVGNPGMVTGSTACALVINPTCSVLANIPCVMNMPTSGRQKLRKITAGLAFHWESTRNPRYKPKDTLVHPACWK